VVCFVLEDSRKQSVCALRKGFTVQACRADGNGLGSLNFARYAGKGQASLFADIRAGPLNNFRIDIYLYFWF